MISDNLRNEIELKHRRIAGDPRTYKSRSQLVSENLRNLGDVYSFWVENPEMRADLVRGDKSRDTLKKMALGGIRSVKNAWNDLQSHSNGKRTVDVISPGVLMRVNSLINGDKAKVGSYRESNVTLGFDVGYKMPNFHDVPQKMDEVIQKAMFAYDEDPLGAAIGFHLGTALVQPFLDGNKRTSRVVQDSILADAGFPPATIAAGEGRYYHKLLADVAVPFQDGDLGGQRPFYDYIASKVNNGLDLILGDLVTD